MKEFVVGIETKHNGYFEREVEANNDIEAMNKVKCAISDSEKISVDDMLVTLVEEL